MNSKTRKMTERKMNALALQCTKVWQTEGASARWVALEAELTALWALVYG